VESYDFVVIGAGASGEAAASLAAERGRRVAIVDPDLFGGSCAFWACMPSKALLHAAAVHHGGGDYPWMRASAFRDWMINREGIDYPDDRERVRSLEKKGATVIRGRARLAGAGRVDVQEISRPEGAGGEPSGRRELETEHVIVAVGSHSRIPPIVGLSQIDYWTNRQGTSTRELPASLIVLGGGPTGVELAQVYARYGVAVTIVDSNDRLLARDHPRNSAAITEALERDGATVRTGVRARSVTTNGAHRVDGSDAGHVIELSDGSRVEGQRILVAVGRAFPVGDLGLETIGVELDDGAPPKPDATLRIADGVYIVGDPAGPEMHTHLAHYEGEMAVRIALGEEITPDFKAIPRATYTDPETASVGLRVEEAKEAGHADAFEETADIGSAAKGYVTEASGHVTIVVDPADGVLLGAFIAGPGASEAIHEAVLAVKLRVPLHVLADTLHAFPTTARVMGGLFAKVARRLAREAAPGG
jgi:pyruvate/2-oxoglutarate dehydrogenase complex dihydrolipoamide dehydrogenase (E3) component